MHKLTIFRRFIGVKHSLNTLFRTSTRIDSSVRAPIFDWGLEKKVFQRKRKRADFWSVSIKVKVFCIAKLRNSRWQVERVSVTNICFATDGKNKIWWTCYLMTLENNDWQGRKREREDVYEKIQFNVFNECENFFCDSKVRLFWLSQRNSLTCITRDNCTTVECKQQFKKIIIRLKADFDFDWKKLIWHLTFHVSLNLVIWLRV